MRRATLLIAVLAATPFASVIAQEQLPPLEPGQRVRITVPDRGISKHNGTLVAVDGDTLTVDTLRVALMNVTRLEMRRAPKARWLKVSMYGGGGLLLGAAAGALSVPLTSSSCVTLEQTQETSAKCLGELAHGPYAKRAVQFGLVGMAIGTVVGVLVSRERWEEVPLNQLRVSFAPQRDGTFALQASLRF